jgi:hypothetical protein
MEKKRKADEKREDRRKRKLQAPMPVGEAGVTVAEHPDHDLP